MCVRTKTMMHRCTSATTKLEIIMNNLDKRRYYLGFDSQEIGRKVIKIPQKRNFSLYEIKYLKKSNFVRVLIVNTCVQKCGTSPSYLSSVTTALTKAEIQKCNL